MMTDHGPGGQQQRGGDPRSQNVSTARGTGTTTTTTTGTSPAASLDWIKLDFLYFRTVPGILKLVQWILGILCMSLGSRAYLGGQHFFLFVVVLTFILTFLWICIYFFSIREGLQLPVPWIILEFYYTAGATLMYFIAMVVQFATGGSGSYVASAVFGLFNTVAYGAGAFFLFQDWKQNSGTSSSTAPNVA